MQISNCHEGYHDDTENEQKLLKKKLYFKFLCVICRKNPQKLKSFIKNFTKNEFNDLCKYENDEDPSLCTILHYLASSIELVGALEIVLRELRQVDYVDRYGVTPLIYAVRYSNTKVVQMLVDKGAKINSTDIYGWSSMNEACYLQNTEILSYLIQNGGDVNSKDKDNRTLLHLACDNGNLDAVKLLLDSGADVNKLDSFGWSPLHICAAHNNVSLIKQLASNQNVNLNISDKAGQKALMWAKHFNSIDAYKYLTQIMKIRKESSAHSNIDST